MLKVSYNETKIQKFSINEKKNEKKKRLSYPNRLKPCTSSATGYNQNLYLE